MLLDSVRSLLGLRTASDAPPQAGAPAQGDASARSLVPDLRFVIIKAPQLPDGLFANDLAEVFEGRSTAQAYAARAKSDGAVAREARQDATLTSAKV